MANQPLPSQSLLPRTLSQSSPEKDQKTFEDLGDLIWNDPDSLTDEDLERYLTLYRQTTGE